MNLGKTEKTKWAGIHRGIWFYIPSGSQEKFRERKPTTIGLDWRKAMTSHEWLTFVQGKNYELKIKLMTRIINRYHHDATLLPKRMR